MPQLTKPTVVYHADWGSKEEKRWCARATLGTDGNYTAFAPKPVGNLGSLIGQLRTEAGETGCALAGFDFPIGIPAFYAQPTSVPQHQLDTGVGRSGFVTDECKAGRTWIAARFPHSLLPTRSPRRQLVLPRYLGKLTRALISFGPGLCEKQIGFWRGMKLFVGNARFKPLPYYRKSFIAPRTPVDSKSTMLEVTQHGRTTNSVLRVDEHSASSSPTLPS